jgi:hypothetical protein
MGRNLRCRRGIERWILVSVVVSGSAEDSVEPAIDPVSEELRQERARHDFTGRMDQTFRRGWDARQCGAYGRWRFLFFDRLLGLHSGGDGSNRNSSVPATWQTPGFGTFRRRCRESRRCGSHPADSSSHGDGSARGGVSKSPDCGFFRCRGDLCVVKAPKSPGPPAMDRRLGNCMSIKHSIPRNRWKAHGLGIWKRSNAEARNCPASSAFH